MNIENVALENDDNVSIKDLQLSKESHFQITQRTCTEDLLSEWHRTSCWENMKLTKKLLFSKNLLFNEKNHKSIAKTEVKIKSVSKRPHILEWRQNNKQIVTIVIRRLPKSMAFAQKGLLETP